MQPNSSLSQLFDTMTISSCKEKVVKAVFEIDLAHERAARVAKAGVAAAALVARAEHVISDAVQRQQARAPPALRRRDHGQGHLLQSVR